LAAPAAPRLALSAIGVDIEELTRTALVDVVAHDVAAVVLVIEPERVADLVSGDRAQVLDVALARSDLGEHVDDRIAQHRAVVRADAVRRAIVEA
jgi:hypothetical protein